MAARAVGYLDITDQECIDLMDDFKERAIIHANRSPVPLGDDWLDETTMAYRVQTISGRQYLQNFGNEARKLFGDTFWIDMVLPNPKMLDGWGNVAEVALERQYPDVDCLCLTDLRYPNEAERVKELGGVVWEVVRPGLESDGHPSETPLPRSLVDHVIDNSGDLSALQREVERAMDTLP